ncbi:MAG: trypsin-like serine protease, partial [Myxococcota bacterium]|nr:trypsin-like serine protease [Myxococcota bacterium]
MSWFILVPLLNLPTAIADEAPPPPIVNGEHTEDWPAVGQLMMCWGGCDMFCSGTLVDERWVITAAHCVEALDEYADYGYKMKFGVGPSLQDIEDSALIASWASHPSYNSYTLKHDIGVIELESDITAVEPMAVNKDSVSNAWVGESLTYVGYGVTSDYENDGGVKRYAEMPLESYDSGLLYSLDTSDGQNVCYGDSGGAALEDLGDGNYELVGVNSYVFGWESNGTACVGGGSGATRVDTHLDFIRDY